MGHIREKDLQGLQGKCMIVGISYCTLDFNFCQHCIYGKHNQVIFAFGATRAKGILELIHNDMFVPVHVSSLGKYMYYL